MSDAEPDPVPFPAAVDLTPETTEPAEQQPVCGQRRHAVTCIEDPGHKDDHHGVIQRSDGSVTHVRWP